LQKKTSKKPALTPQAAKILEQYRSAGKAPGSKEGAGPVTDDDGGGNRQTSGPANPAIRQRSGTRGK
jgi:hypothetical protein